MPKLGQQLRRKAVRAITRYLSWEGSLWYWMLRFQLFWLDES